MSVTQHHNTDPLVQGGADDSTLSKWWGMIVKKFHDGFMKPMENRAFESEEVMIKKFSRLVVFGVDDNGKEGLNLPPQFQKVIKNVWQTVQSDLRSAWIFNQGVVTVSQKPQQPILGYLFPVESQGMVIDQGIVDILKYLKYDSGTFLTLLMLIVFLLNLILLVNPCPLINNTVKMPNTYRMTLDEFPKEDAYLCEYAFLYIETLPNSTVFDGPYMFVGRRQVATGAGHIDQQKQNDEITVIDMNEKVVSKDKQCQIVMTFYSSNVTTTFFQYFATWILYQMCCQTQKGIVVHGTKYSVLGKTHIQDVNLVNCINMMRFPVSVDLKGLFETSFIVLTWTRLYDTTCDFKTQCPVYFFEVENAQMNTLYGTSHEMLFQYFQKIICRRCILNDQEKSVLAALVKNTTSDADSYTFTRLKNFIGPIFRQTLQSVLNTPSVFRSVENKFQYIEKFSHNLRRVFRLFQDNFISFISFLQKKQPDYFSTNITDIFFHNSTHPIQCVVESEKGYEQAFLFVMICGMVTAIMM